MKKYITLLIAVAMTSSFAFAVDGERPDRPDRPKRPTLEQQIDRIGAILENEEISDRKKAYLENRLAVMEIQSDFRAAVKAKIAELSAEATKEERHEALKTVRESFADALEGMKVSRREVFERRRQLRKKAGEDDA